MTVTIGFRDWLRSCWEVSRVDCCVVGIASMLIELCWITFCDATGFKVICEFAPISPIPRKAYFGLRTTRSSFARLELIFFARIILVLSTVEYLCI